MKRAVETAIKLKKENPDKNIYILGELIHNTDVINELEKMGIKHYEIPDIERKDPVTIIKTLKMVSKIIKDENINIVHTHHRMAAFYTRILSFFKKFTFIIETIY